MIVKGGFVIASKMGDPNASIPTPQPIIYRNMFGAHGKAKFGICATFVSQASIDNGSIASYGLQKMVLPVSNCRNISKSDLIHNDKTPTIEVNPENYKVTVDGKWVTCEPAEKSPLSQLYFLF